MKKRILLRRNSRQWRMYDALSGDLVGCIEYKGEDDIGSHPMWGYWRNTTPKEHQKPTWLLDTNGLTSKEMVLRRASLPITTQLVITPSRRLRAKAARK